MEAQDGLTQWQKVTRTAVKDAYRRGSAGWILGLPSNYVYQGTGESMSADEAEWWLTRGSLQVRSDLGM